jgi:hypothetical protein
MSGSQTHIEPASLEDLPQLADLLADLFSHEADFRPDHEKQMRGLRLILEQPNRGRIFVLRAGDRIMGIAQIGGNLFRLHHEGTPLRQRSFFPRLRIQPRELLDRMAQPIGLALCPLDFVAVTGELLLAGAALLPKPFDLRRFVLQPPERVKQPAMGRYLH